MCAKTAATFNGPQNALLSLCMHCVPIVHEFTNMVLIDNLFIIIFLQMG